jgi:hypothetical protein
VVVSNQAIGDAKLPAWKQKLALIAAAVRPPLPRAARIAHARAAAGRPVPPARRVEEGRLPQAAAGDVGRARARLRRGRRAARCVAPARPAQCAQCVRIDRAASFFVGDAAGRKGDFACTDRKWALNVGIAFQTPEVGRPGRRSVCTRRSPRGLMQEYFLGLQPAAYTLPGFTVKTLPARAPRLRAHPAPLTPRQSPQTRPRRPSPRSPRSRSLQTKHPRGWSCACSWARRPSARRASSARTSRPRGTRT